MTSEEKTETMDPRVLAVSQEVAALAGAAVEEIGRAATSEELEKLRVTYLGKQSRIMLLSKELGKVPAELRPAFGEAVNAGKKRLQEALTERKASMGAAGASLQERDRRDAAGDSQGGRQAPPVDADHGGGQSGPPGDGIPLRRLSRG